MINYIRSFFQVLTANAHPGEVAHAAAWGVILALMPKNNLLWPLLFIVTMLVRINKGTLFLVFIGFGFAAPFFDGIINRMGYFVLSQELLLPLYTKLYAIPFVGLTMFNNTMVAGSLVLGILLYIPAYLIMRVMVKLYRTHLQPKIAQSKPVRFILNIPLVRKLLHPEEIIGSL